MIAQFALGLFMIILTVIMHGVALDKLITILGNLPQYFTQKRNHISTKTAIMVITVLYIFLAHVAQIWVWALCYMELGVLQDLESALYFSTSSFTTVGFGDVYLGKDWRLLSSFEAANGFILFGWSTAFIFEVMTKIYKPSEK